MTMSYIPRTDFEDLVPDNPGTVRLNHDHGHCSGDSRNLLVERTSDGYAKCYCFRCGLRGGYWMVRHFQSHQQSTELAGPGEPSPGSGRLVGIERIEAGVAPERAVDFPPDGRSWLAKSGFSLTDAGARGCVWSSREQCLFIPVEREGYSGFGAVIPGYVRRKWSPKGYNVLRLDQEPLWGHYRGPEVAPPWMGGRNPVVLVEDVLSAWRVSEVADCVALCGTELHSPVITALAGEGYTDAIVWLDADNPTVRMKARKIATRLGGLMATHIVETGKDPKHENMADVRAKLVEVLDTPR